MPLTRISDHILHVGIHVTDIPKSDRFYKEILGFRLLWQGGPQNNPKAWMSYLVPNGSDWLEYMTSANPTPKQLGGMHHVCLEVKDIQQPYDIAWSRGYKPPGASGSGTRRPLAEQLLRSGWIAYGDDDPQTGGQTLLHGSARSVHLSVVSETMRHSLLILFALIAAFHARPAAAQAAFDLRCERNPSPKGVKNPKPQFSWSVAPTAVQRGFQVLVASSEEKLKADQGNLWDSGRVLSDKKQAEYKEKPLPSLQRCYWKVRIWGNYYTATSWSDAATFQMGVRSSTLVPVR